MSYFNQNEVKKLQISNEVNVAPFGDSILAYLGIDRATVKFIKAITKRTYRAVINWLIKKYQPRNDSNLEKVRSYLEAFHHLCEVEACEKTSEILFIHFNTHTKEQLHNQLYTWGYYREPLDLYNRILHKLNSRIDAIIFNNCGNYYLTFGDLGKVIEYYNHSLTITQQIGDFLLESQCLGNLGLAYRGSAYDCLGEYKKAIKFYFESLSVARQLENHFQEAVTLRLIGLAYSALENHHQAILSFEQCLAVAQEINAPTEVGRAVSNIGSAYYDLGNYPKAIEYYQQHLDIARQIGDREGEAAALCNLGNTQSELKRYTEAWECLRAAREIFREIGELSSEAITLYNLAELHYQMGNFDLALSDCASALSIATELGIPLAEECQKLKEEIIKG